MASLGQSFGGLRLTQQALLKPSLVTSSTNPLVSSVGCLHCAANTRVRNTPDATSHRSGVGHPVKNKRLMTLSSNLLNLSWSLENSDQIRLKAGIHQRQFHQNSSVFQEARKTSADLSAKESQHKESSLKIDQEISENLEQMRKRDFEKGRVSHPEDLQHFRKDSKGAPSPPPSPTTTEVPSGVNGSVAEELPIGVQTLPHPIWTEEEVHNVQITHKEPEGIVDRLAYFSVKLLRKSFDVLSGYNRKVRDESVWINRICFLETVAGVPGMVGAMVRHLHSLRRMRRDHGWIHTLLEEAENERMHLMTALQLKQPGIAFRMAVVGAQGCMVTFFSLAYLVSPKYCHRFVGYLEEEAVVTYTKCLQDIESGQLQHWKTQPAPYVAMVYWKLPPEATMKDVILAIRADEAHHRVVNHTLGSMKSDDYNPYKPGE